MKRSMLLLIVLLFQPSFAQLRWELRMHGLPSDGLYRSVSTVNSGVVWLSSIDSIWRSFDGGRSWSRAGILPTLAGSPTVVVGLDDNKAIYCTDAGKIVKTTNGGLAWVIVFDDTSATTCFNDLEMFDLQKGFAMGDPPDLFRQPCLVGTTDGGETWIRINTNLPIGDWQNHGRTDFIDPDTGWSKVVNDGIFRTVDGGTTWEKVFSSSLPSNVFMLDDSVGFFSTGGSGGQTGGIYKTMDGGDSWRQTLSTGLLAFVRWPHGGTSIWAGLDTLFVSLDKGETWAPVLSTNSIGGSGFCEASFLSDTSGLVVGNYVVLGVSVDPVSVNNSPVRLPIEIVLSQNFPNPFNPTTTIRYGLPVHSQVSLDIYSTLGEHIATLVNGEQEAGYHEIPFAGNGLASGVYIARLVVTDILRQQSRSAAMKLLLIK